jgi:hypothetical protein
MIKQIWKYKLDGVISSIEIPLDGKVLTVQIQNEVPHIWVLVNPENQVETRGFRVVGTGHPFDDTDSKYIGTFQDGPFVWHLFEMVY